MFESLQSSRAMPFNYETHRLTLMTREYGLVAKSIFDKRDLTTPLFRVIQVCGRWLRSVGVNDFDDRVKAERERQDEKWGVQNHNDLFWHVILGEEVGEVAEAIISQDNVLEEVIQVAAVAVAWVEAIQRRE